MTKAKPKAKVVSSSARRSHAKSKPRSPAKAVCSKLSPRSNTKHARILAMLGTPAGATIAAIMTATDWQQHSVRGFLAGVVRKKLGLNLMSELTDGVRVYRIKDGKTKSAAAIDHAKQAA